MSPSEKKNKLNGIIGTIIFHVLGFYFAYFFLGLTYRIPPPAEEGISINFGYDEIGIEEVIPEENATESNKIIEEIVQENIKIEQEVITQELIETKIVEAPKDFKKNIKEEPEKIEEEEIVIKEVEPKLNNNALYKGKKTTDKKTDGNKEYQGNQGSLDGDKNSTEYEGGGIGDDGLNYQLSGRTPTEIVKPNYDGDSKGIVVVEITVDKLGNVLSAIPGGKGSTTLDEQLLKLAKEAALKTKWNSKESAPTRQAGKLIYKFKN